MKTLRLVLCAILFALFAVACQPKNPLVPEPGIGSMKGYELYSWKKGDGWYFSILIGTNREKTLEEIQAPDAALKGMEELEAALTFLPTGQTVIWIVSGPLAFPPENLIKQVEDICKKQGLELIIVR